MGRLMLSLKPGAELIERGEQAGLALRGRTRMARDAGQTALLRALCSGGLPLDGVAAVLCPAGSAATEADSALALAAFILDFEFFLES